MYEYHIYSQLKKYAKAKRDFHIPGHKASGDFKARFKDALLDVTELSYTDNLHSPLAAIAKAQKDIAKILGAKASYITTDGSSSGVYALASCAAKRGNKIIVFRNSHQSVWNACKLFNLEPLIVQSEEKDGVLLPPDCDSIEKLIADDSKIAGILATSPDYYGNVAPLEAYAKMLKKHNRLLLVDQAHGAHFAFGEECYAGRYADAWVDGAHKTLPTLTQGAVVSVNNEEFIPVVEDALSLFRTTSPSFPIMASVEYGIKLMVNRPEYIKKAKQAVKQFKEGCKGEFEFYKNDDWTKLLIDFKPLGISSHRVMERLEKDGYHPELADGRYILFYLSPMTKASDLEALKKKLKSIVSNRKLKGTYRERPPIPQGERTYSFLYASNRQSEWVELEKAEGRRCAKNAGIMPPCIPIVITGDIIKAVDVKALSHKNTFGLKDGKICVIKK